MDIVETATAPTEFSVLSFVKDTAYPTGEVVIYTNVVAAKEIERLFAKRQLLETKNMDEAEKLTPLIEAAVAEAEKTKLIFNLRGFPPGIIQQMMEQYNTDESDTEADPHLVAKAIISVENAEGAKDGHLWTGDEVNELRGSITPGEWLKLLSAVADVLFNATIFDDAVDAGFLGRRPDVAA